MYSLEHIKQYISLNDGLRRVRLSTWVKISLLNLRSLFETMNLPINWRKNGKNILQKWKLESWWVKIMLSLFIYCFVIRMWVQK